MLDTDSLEMPKDVYTVHICFMPSRDCERVWIGSDISKYVDYYDYEGNNPLYDWFAKYGAIEYVDWRYYYPQVERKTYINYLIKEHGYSRESAEQILAYLPQTNSEYFFDDISQMIELYKDQKPIVDSDDHDPIKRKIACNAPNMWDSQPFSPKLAGEMWEGFLQGYMEITNKPYTGPMTIEKLWTKVTGGYRN